MKIPTQKWLPLLLTSVFALGSAANAAVITWGSVEDTTGVSVVSTTGTLVSAYNAGTSTVEINGETWLSSNPLGTYQAGLLGGATTDDANFTTLLDQASSGGGSTTAASIDLGTFTTGHIYEIQVFYTDQRTSVAGLNDRFMSFSSTDGTTTGDSVEVESDPDNIKETEYGQYVIGTFTADGSDPDLLLIPYLSSFGNSHITAYQIRDITSIPEPSVVALLGIGGLAMGLRRRVKC
ncbi:PEP-CTERM sorting domain-containing protein [Luteolibacter pohnpeiensis]|uniref:PEP-CTERM sorting domain-containing protein n=1 Tax=Luteolibacter pohnpeiensis TaxID=454153 RepID=A0A934S5U4_9BACT|nr:PEP-CTERM sorting domain-containing protein [Luteolibacter pohnpeiensis]MBK1881311.1 PEP-CTERM sorting domain-containing protein [Luteolibacter pohnpeiensis]